MAEDVILSNANLQLFRVNYHIGRGRTKGANLTARAQAQLPGRPVPDDGCLT